MFVVGGAVRDWLLQRPVKDYDLLIRGLPMEDLVRTLETLGEVNVVGQRFGVIKFKPQDDSRWFDIALPRKEYSWAFSGGYRDFDIQSDHTLEVEVDLSRRDFTINAMAYNVATGEIVDPFFGQKDITAKIIRTVGSAATRFQEDYSRMLRALRFACRLNFSLSEATRKAIVRLAPHIHDQAHDDFVVPREVISQEFLKAFDASPTICLTLLDELGFLALLFPELKALQSCQQTPPHHTEGNAYDHVLLALQLTTSADYRQHFPDPLPLLSKLAILFHDLGKPSAATERDGVIHFYNHEIMGAKLTNDIAHRLRLGSTPYYPFSHTALAWVVREHLYAIKHREQRPRATELERLFFSPRHPGQALLHCMLADQMASVPDKPERQPTPIISLLAEIHRLAPTGTMPPPLISGDNVLEWLDIKPGKQVAEILNAVREEQLQQRIDTVSAAKTYILSHYG